MKPPFHIDDIHIGANSSPRRRPVRLFSRRAGHHLRGRADMAAPRLFIASRIVGSIRLCGQSLRDQQPVKFARHAEIIHPTNRLSNAVSLAGFNSTSERGQKIGHSGQAKGARHGR